MPLQAFNVETGEAVEIGDTVTDFRGDIATLISVDRARQPGKSGLVSVRWDAYRQPGHDAGVWDYYDNVFGLEVREVERDAEPYDRLTSIWTSTI